MGRKKHSPLNGYISLSDSGELDGKETWSRMTAALNPEEWVIDRGAGIHDTESSGRMSQPFELSVLNLLWRDTVMPRWAIFSGKKEKSVDNGLRRIKGKLQDILEGMNQGKKFKK